MLSLNLFERLLKRSILLILILISFNFSFAQPNDLIKKLPKLKGKDKVLTLCDIAAIYSGTDPKKSLEFSRKALVEATKLKKNDLILEAYNLLSVGHLVSGNFDSTIIISRQTIKLAKKINNRLIIGKAYTRIALAKFEQGKYKEAIQANFKGLKIFEEEKNIVFQGLTLTNIATGFEKLSLFEDALKYNQKVLEIAKKVNSTEMLSNTYGNIGVIKMKLKNFKEADENFKISLTYILENPDSKKLATLYQNLGVNARSMGDSKSGIDYYTKALNLSKQIQDNAAIGFLYNNLGNCYLDLKNLNTAKNYIDSGFVIAKQNQSLSLLRNSYRALSKFEILNGNFLKADEYYDKYESFRDSVLNVEKIKAVSEIQTKYDVQAKEKEILNQRTKSAELQKKLYASFGIVASLVLTLLLFWQYSQNKLKKRELINLNKLNNERNRIARDLHDNLGAELTVVASKLDTKIFKTENDSDKNDLIQIADLTRNAGVVLRETVWSIKSEKLTVVSLKDKIEEHIQRIESNENLVFDVDSQEIEAELSPTVALNFFRITQEAISNILKYSNAKKVNIKLSSKSLEITDNGIGFEVNSIKKGYGLNNMEARSKEINANFSIRSSQNGTTILVSLT